jgi:hypothetical protein
VPACLIAIYVGIGVTEVLDNTLSRMHQPGGASAGASTVASPLSLLSRNAVAEAIGQWKEWGVLSENTVGAANAGVPLGGLLGIYLFADVIFVALPIWWMLFNLNRRASERLKNYTPSKLSQSDSPGADSSEKQDRKDRDWLINFLKKARWAATAFLVSAVVVDFLLIAAAREEGNGILIWATGGTALAKWGMFCFAFVALLVGRFGSRRMRADEYVNLESKVKEARKEWVYLLALRIQIGVGALLLFLGALRGDLGRQLDDAFLFLFSGWGIRAWETLLLAVVLVIVMLVTANQSFRSYLPKTQTKTRSDAPEGVGGDVQAGANWKNFGFAILGVALIAIGVTAHSQSWRFGIVCIAPGGLFLLLAILSFFVSPPEPTLDVLNTKTEMISKLGWQYSVAFSVIPLVVLSALGARNGVRLLTIHQICYGSALIVTAVFIMPAVGYVIVRAMWYALVRSHLLDDRKRDDPAASPVARPVPLSALAAGLASVAIVFLAGISPQVTGTALGPWSSVFVLCIALTLAGTALVMFSDHIRTWGFLVAIGFRRTPLIAAILLCFVINAAIDDRNSYHDVRLATELAGSDSASPRLEPRIALTAALDQWAAEQRKNNAADDREIPLVFIASAGGGIRAAYWTALVIRCLVEGDENGCTQPVLPMNSIFLASGISGGSLGLVGIHGLPDANAWLEALRQDFLGPTIAGFAFRDVPNSLLHIDIHDSDRAAMLERAWENAAVGKGGRLDRGLVETAYRADGSIAFPLLVLNGTSVIDGCRVAATVLDLSTVTPPDGQRKSSSTDCLALNQDRFTKPDVALPALPATKDVFDNTCSGDGGNIPSDIRLSTAALLSARFPYVSPTGTLYACNSDDRTFVLDGGLIDSSGALPLAMLWPEVVKWLTSQHDSVCYAPKLIIMENSYLEQTKSEPTTHPSELAAPLDATMATQAAAAPTARQAAALTFQKSFGTSRCHDSTQSSPEWSAPNVVDFYPVAQPGIQAPLGWTLSSYSRKSLENEVASRTNRCAAEIVSAWFSGSTQKPPACPQATPQ